MAYKIFTMNGGSQHLPCYKDRLASNRKAKFRVSTVGMTTSINNPSQVVNYLSAIVAQKMFLTLRVILQFLLSHQNESILQ